MEELLEIAIKSAGVLLLFVGVYHFLLKRLTFFNANRWFLIGGLIASVVFPFIEITQTVYVDAPQAVFVPQEIASPMAMVLESQPIAPQEPLFEWSELLLYAYLAVVLFFLGKMCIELASLVTLIRSGAREKRDGFVYVTLSRKLTPFSFFNYICYSAHEKNTADLDLIIDHEKVHARDWHSVDLLLSHLYRAVFWFNPLAWIVKKQIGENLEFIADSRAKSHHAHGHTYERALLSRAASHMQPALANNFFTPFIKQRIVMLQKEASATWNAYKYALILPVIVLFLYSFNRVTEIEYVENNIKEILNVPYKKSDLSEQQKVNRVVEKEANAIISDTINRSLFFEIASNTLDIDFAEHEKLINEQMPYKIKYEQIKRDVNGRLVEVLVACKFPNSPWNKYINLKIKPQEINHFYVHNTNFQIQIGDSNTDWYGDDKGIEFMDRNNGIAINYDINNKKKPVKERFDTTSEYYNKLATFLKEYDTSLPKVPLLILNEKIVSKAVFEKAFNTLDGEALGYFLNPKEAMETYGPDGANGAWMISILTIESNKNGTVIFSKEPLNPQEDGLGVDKMEYFITGNATDVILDKYQKSTSMVMLYEIKFENRKRDSNGSLTSVVVASKFDGKDWNRNVELDVKKNGRLDFTCSGGMIKIKLGNSGKLIQISKDEVETIYMNGSNGVRSIESNEDEQSKIDSQHISGAPKISFFPAQNGQAGFFVENGHRYELGSSNQVTRLDEHGDTIVYLVKNNVLLKKRPGVATEIIKPTNQSAVKADKEYIGIYSIDSDISYSNLTDRSITVTTSGEESYRLALELYDRLHIDIETSDYDLRTLAKKIESLGLMFEVKSVKRNTLGQIKVVSFKINGKTYRTAKGNGINRIIIHVNKKSGVISVEI